MAKQPTAERNRVASDGRIVRDTRAYLHVADDYKRGDPLRPPRRSSPARARYHADRLDERAAARYGV